MGQEIAAASFCQRDFDQFQQKLQQETAQLHEQLLHAPDDSPLVIGIELEAWLLQKNMSAAAINAHFLSQLNNNEVNAELAKFNIEFNSQPRTIRNSCLSKLHNAIQTDWSAATQQAQRIDAELMMIGILPTLKQDDLTTQNMSCLNRYQALNEQILNVRGKPVQLDISGIEHLKLTHNDVMLESAATSLQIHTQVPTATAHHYYNAAILASSMVVACAANSPFLFGRQLWHETRIPLFEQAIETGGYAGAAHGPIKRVSFGNGYARENIFECFQENLEHYPVLLPVDLTDSDAALAHLRLHNGTIWRWNRPLIGVDEQGQLHVRIEHRTPAAGPTVIDCIANTAFYLGLSLALADSLKTDLPPLSFSQAKDNFYKAARYGLDATVTDFSGKQQRLQKAILEQCLPSASEALKKHGLNSNEVDCYLSVIERRVAKQQTGSDWQLKFIEKHGRDFQRMTRHYLYHQQSNEEVSTWSL